MGRLGGAFVLVIIAAVCFALAAWPMIEPRNHRLVAAGLFLLTIAYLATHWPG